MVSPGEMRWCSICNIIDLNFHTLLFYISYIFCTSILAVQVIITEYSVDLLCLHAATFLLVLIRFAIYFNRYLNIIKREEFIYTKKYSNQYFLSRCVESFHIIAIAGVISCYYSNLTKIIPCLIYLTLPIYGYAFKLSLFLICKKYPTDEYLIEYTKCAQNITTFRIFSDELTNVSLNVKSSKCQESGKYDVCVICHEAIELGQVVTKLDCNHCFHIDCIAQWFEIKIECPLCKSTSDDIMNLKSVSTNYGTID